MTTIRDIENKAVEALLGACHPLDRTISAELQEALAARERIEDAAPELLAACKEAAHWIDGCGAEGSSEVIRNLAAAIAKAEGRA